MKGWFPVRAPPVLGGPDSELSADSYSPGSPASLAFVLYEGHASLDLLPLCPRNWLQAHPLLVVGMHPPPHGTQESVVSGCAVLEGGPDTPHCITAVPGPRRSVSPAEGRLVSLARL